MICFRLSFFLTISFILMGCTNSKIEPEQKRIHKTQNQVLLPVHDPVYADTDVISQLEALGYLGGHEVSGGPTGIIIHENDLVQPGYNLVVSGHDAEITLLSMDGTLLHKWECARSKAFPNITIPAAENKTKSFRKAYSFPNGDVIGIYNGTGMVRLDKDSNIIWRQPAMCHHDLTVGPNEKLYTFIQKKRVFPEFNPDEIVFDDYIAEIDLKTGEILSQHSLIEAFYNSTYASCLKKIPLAGDIFHANTIEYIGPESAKLLPIYKENHLLISMRNMDAIAIVDAQTCHISWVMTGMWSYQHEPSIMPDGNILIFDNTGHHERSKVIEFDPLTQSIVWDYSDSTETPLFSSTSGASHRLPNGNTLIVESNSGRVIEVTRDKRIVWKYINTHRWGGNKNLVATLFDVHRLPVDFFDSNFQLHSE